MFQQTIIEIFQSLLGGKCTMMRSKCNFLVSKGFQVATVCIVQAETISPSGEHAFEALWSIG